MPAWRDRPSEAKEEVRLPGRPVDREPKSGAAAAPEGGVAARSLRAAAYPNNEELSAFHFI